MYCLTAATLVERFDTLSYFCDAYVLVVFLSGVYVPCCLHALCLFVVLPYWPPYTNIISLIPFSYPLIARDPAPADGGDESSKLFIGNLSFEARLCCLL